MAPLTYSKLHTQIRERVARCMTSIIGLFYRLSLSPIMSVLFSQDFEWGVLVTPSCGEATKLKSKQLGETRILSPSGPAVDKRRGLPTSQESFFILED